MNENTFWKLIEKSKRRAVVPDSQGEILADFLAQLETEEIYDFDRILHGKLNAAYRWDLWAVAYIIHHGCSDDSFEYFRAWLISQGQDVYEEALRRPESVGDIVEPGDFADNEHLLYAAQTAFDKQTGSELLLLGSTVSSPLEPSGTRWNEEDLLTTYPALCERFEFSLETTPGAKDIS